MVFRIILRGRVLCVWYATFRYQRVQVVVSVLCLRFMYYYCHSRQEKR